jgi:YgiT-type zinc finger domain-containing protein
MSLYEFPCEYCNGVVRERILAREPISHHRGIVVLENVPIGICERCGAHYFAAPVLKRAEAILTAGGRPARTMEVPVETY